MLTGAGGVLVIDDISLPFSGNVVEKFPFGHDEITL